MRFLTVAERELRAGARRKATYRTRWITAMAFFGLLLWLMWAWDAFQFRRAAPQVFNTFSVLTFIYCIILGTALTADCLSSERREGTLGLLFLTNLNSAEIVAGKVCSSALASVYGLLSIFPMLALPMLMGGVTFEQFWRTILALLVTIFFSISAGFVATVICRRQFLAVALAMGLAFAYGTGLMLVGTIFNAFGRGRGFAAELASFCPLYTLIAAREPRLLGKNYFWLSVFAVTGVSLIWLGFAVWRLARTWRDRPKSVSRFERVRLFQRWRQLGSSGRLAMRRRLLDINPFYWLGGRKLVSAPFFMILVLFLVAFTSYVTNPFFGRVLPPVGAIKPMLGHMFAWLWTGLAIHALVTYYAAMSASQRMAEDKQTGALELILSTPTTERTISRGLWMAYGRRILFPVLVAVLVHFFFVWQCMTLFILEPPGRIPLGTTPGQLFWAALLGEPLKGFQLYWHFGFLLRCGMAALALFLVVWFTLGWVGRWLGLRMKHPGFAPIVGLALVFVPPVMLFTVMCIVADEINLDRLPERQVLPLMMWLTIGIMVGHCLLMSVWAAWRLRRDLRTIVTNRFQPPRKWQFALPRPRTIIRFALFAVGLPVLAVLIVLLFYGYHNWRSQRAWTAFQADLKRRGESLDLSKLLPAPAPDSQNFARSAAFKNLQAATNSLKKLLGNLQPWDVRNNALANDATMEWSGRRFNPLADATKKLASGFKLPNRTNRTDYAPVVLQGLGRHDKALRELAAAAQLPSFQISTGSDAGVIFQSQNDALITLERLHLLFQQRASALLVVNRVPEAGEDVLTTLRLARLARQAVDVRSMARQQAMSVRSLQPIWEGLAERKWNEARLVDFQKELATFNHLIDYTNAVRRVVLANIDIWRAIPESSRTRTALRQGGGYVHRAEWDWQPRGWWYDNCLELYSVGQSAIKKVDVAGGRVTMEYDWNDLNGLVLEDGVDDLLTQNIWRGKNPDLVSFAQTALNLGIIACALERYRLVHGKIPQNLDELIPAYLDRVPYDIVVGRPMAYQRIDDDYFILRSVGPDETDDRKSKASDDWLWQYPTNAPALKR